jgi:2-desacetyl-2-hydroxyethyl bacteriochlorophyllide A dehydrogenase
MANRLVFPAKQQVHLEEFATPAITGAQVAVRSLCSLMSTGTENIVFNRQFEAGSHWDGWVKYPFFPGYATVGEVIEAGPEATSLTKGDRVVLRASHASHHVVPESKCTLIPAGIEPYSAAWFALAKISFMGARAAEYELGDSVAIIGAGPIGQMSVRWAAAAGAENVVAIDTVAMRLDLARNGGATATIAKPIGESLDDLRAIGGGNLPRVVLDGTGNAEVFPHALAAARDFGRVVLLGDTGTPSEQRLTPDLLRRGLTLVGAHDRHARGEWDAKSIYRLFFSLILSGRFRLDGLATHTFTPEDCALAYQTANTRRGETMGIIFDWSRA